MLAITLTALYGLARGRTWGRWISISWAIEGVWFCFLDTLFIMSTGDAERALVVPISLLTAALFSLMILCLTGASMRQRYDSRPGARPPLNKSNRRGRLIVAGTILSLSMLPILWAISLFGSARGDLRFISEGLIAGSLTLGAILLFRQRTAGLLFLLLGSGGSSFLFIRGALHVVQKGDIIECLSNLFALALLFGPTIVGGVLLLLAAARPMWRFLRR
jgi:hypothetical protein